MDETCQNAGRSLPHGRADAASDMTTRGIMRWRTAGLLLAMLFIVGLPYVVTLQGARDTQRATEWVARSAEVKALAYRIAYIVHDSEAASYRLLAGDANAATRTRAERVGNEVSPLLRDLRGMTRDNPDQQALMGSLAASVNGRLTLMNQALERLRQGNPAGARQSLRDADDLFGMNPQIAGIVQIEDGLLQQRQQAAARQSLNGRIVLSTTALAQLLLLAIIVIASERQIGRRQLAETR